MFTKHPSKHWDIITGIYINLYISTLYVVNKTWLMALFTWNPLVEYSVFIFLCSAQQLHHAGTVPLAVTGVHGDVVGDAGLQLGDVELHTTPGSDVADQEPDVVSHLGHELLRQPAIESLGTSYSQSPVVFVCDCAIGRSVRNT